MRTPPRPINEHQPARQQVARTRRRRGSAGFTLIELLVVIAIIGLLMAILLPAVSSVREAARRMSCQSNLKQLATAVIAYADTHGMIPPAGMGSLGSSTYMNFTGYAMILPYLEQRGVYDLFNFDAQLTELGGYGWASPANSTACGTQVDIFLCPSNIRNIATPMGVIIGTSTNWYLPKAAVTDYLLCGGASPYVEENYDSLGLPLSGSGGNLPYPGINVAYPHLRGVSGFNTTVNRGDIKDGTTNTILLGESVGGNDANQFYATGTGSSRTCLPITTPISSMTPYYDNLMFMAFANQRPNGDRTVTIGGLVAVTVDRKGNPYPANDCGYESDARIASFPATPSDRLGQQLPNFRSVHQGGVFAAMADGSVQFINDSMDVQVYMAMSTIAGGEVGERGASSAYGL